VKVPPIRYAQNGDISLAYSQFGAGPDLVLVPGFVSNVEAVWEEPSLARWFERLGAFARVTLFDKRGTGLSERGSALPTMDERMDDMRAVMDDAGVESASLFGVSEGGAATILFAATEPARTSALVLWGTWARLVRGPDCPYGVLPSDLEAMAGHVQPAWGTGVGLGAWAPSKASDPRFREWFARFQRQSASPHDAVRLITTYAEIDVRDVLPALRIPVLVLHRRGDRMVPVDAGRDIAARVPGARMVELPGDGHLFWTGEQDEVLAEIEEFLTGERSAPDHDRVLATVLFTDVVESTRHLSAIGDRPWRDLVAEHESDAKRAIEVHRGRRVKSTGDGLLAVFDGPTRAIRCAEAIVDLARRAGIELRAGLHTGEIEVLDDGDVSGLAVNIAARVAAAAEPGEVLVSRTLADLVAGSGIALQPRGTRELKGVPGEWALYGLGR
jgi:class 3 adenylate cyclase